MPRDFPDWMRVYAAASAGDDYASVRTVILEAETRIPVQVDAFKTRLAAIFDRLTAGGEADAPASHDSLRQAILEIAQDPASTFLLPVSGAPFSDGRTHVTGGYLARFATFGDFDSDSRAPRRLPVTSGDVFPAWKTSVWFTPDSCPTDPQDVARVLGLPHFVGQIAYRLEFALASVPQFTPSCLDAGLYPAWQEPPIGHAGRCGVTRHLETGQRMHNEFVVRTGDVLGQDVVLERLPAAAAVARIGALTPDYVRGR